MWVQTSLTKFWYFSNCFRGTRQILCQCCRSGKKFCIRTGPYIKIFRIPETDLVTLIPSFLVDLNCVNGRMKRFSSNFVKIPKFGYENRNPWIKQILKMRQHGKILVNRVRYLVYPILKKKNLDTMWCGSAHVIRRIRIQSRIRI